MPDSHDASDRLLADLVVGQGLATREQVEECLAALRQLRESGAQPIPTLGQLLLERGLVDPTRQGATVRVAPSPAAGADSHDLGKYVLVEILGRGGMGEVWKAWDKELDRFVAVKFILHASAEDRRRLKREAQVAARLEHPHIVGVYEVGESPRGDYIAMKWVDGTTLDRAPLSLDQQLAAVRDAALAIEHAHRQGVIHRDVKPQNLLVEHDSLSPAEPASRLGASRAPHVYVTDFGLARVHAPGSSLSGSGTVVGTPGYMPPEQAAGKSSEIDERSDVYSLGATLYHTRARRSRWTGSRPPA